MKRYKLKDLSINKLEYGSGAAACEYDGSTRYVRITDIDNNGKLGNDIVSPNCVDEKYILNNGDVLFARTGATVGKTYRYHESDGRCLYAGFLIRVIPNRNIIRPDYLYYFTKSPQYNSFVQSSMKVVAQPNINAKQYGDLEFNVPELKVQDEIIERLSKIIHVINLRKQELQKLDELIKARFIELFGNLVIGDKVDTNKKKIGEIASVTKLAGFEFTKYIQYKKQGDIIMLRGLNCKKGHLILDDIKWIDKETSDLLPRSKLYYGDILMTYAGTIGDVAMVDADDKYHLAPNVAKITLNDKKACNPIFLMHLFMYTNDYIMTFASVVAQASINMEKIRNFEYYFPPVEQQNQFAAFVEQTDKSKVIYIKQEGALI